MAIALAEKEGADLVMATDPDCDRMGVAVRNRARRNGTAHRQPDRLADGGVSRAQADRAGRHHAGERGRCVIVKTFVTTDLQKAIAEKHGLRCVETLTGFKYIGEKLGKYEDALPADVRGRTTARSPRAETRALRLKHSSFYVCGGEESYGYSAADFVRDKDGNGAVVVFAEVAAYAKSRGLTLDRIARRNLRGVRLLPGKERHADLRGRGRRGEDPARSSSPTPRSRRRRCDGAAVTGDAQLRRRDVQGRRRRRDPEGKDAHDRSRRRPARRRAPVRHGAEDQILHVRPSRSEGRPISRPDELAAVKAEAQRLARRALAVDSGRM